MSLIFDTTMEAIILFKDEIVINCNQVAIELFNKESKLELIGKISVKLFMTKNY